MKQTRKIFISYSHRGDRTWVQYFARFLGARHFVCVPDPNALPAGKDMDYVLEGALDAADAIVLVIGRTQNEDQRREWAEALRRVWAVPSKRLLPILLPGTELPSFLRDRMFIEVKKDKAGAEFAAAAVAESFRPKSEWGTVKRGAARELRKERAIRLREIERAAKTLWTTPQAS